MGHVVDFTQGKIIRQMVLFSVPIVLGELFQNLYNSVDALIVGNFVGETALAAVSICTPIADFLIGFFNGMSIGASVLVGRAAGEGRQEKLSLTMRVSFTFSVILGAVLTTLGIILAPVLLQMTDVVDEVYQETIIYLRIYLGGLMFTVIYNIGAGILRAVGNAKTPFIILVVSCCVNILLDILLVTAVDLGVVGVAIATVLSQLVSVLLIYRALSHRDEKFSLAFPEMRVHRYIVKKMMGIGMPAGVQSSLISVSNLFIWRYVNRFGSAAMAGVGVAQRLDKFVALPGKAFGMTLTTFVSQNVGAKNRERSNQGIISCMVLSLSVISVLGTIVFCFAPVCVTLFNSEPEIVEIGVSMMRSIIPFYGLLVVREVFLGALRGYGNTRVPMVLSLVGMVGLRQVFLAVSMQANPTLVNIYICYPISWGATAIMIIIYYGLVMKKLGFYDGCNQK